MTRETSHMKIAHYLNHGRRANGHVELAVDLACEQANQGYDVHYVCGTCDFADTLSRNGVTLHTLPDEEGPFRLAGMALRFGAVARRLRPDIVNAHMPAAAVAATVVRPFLGFKLVTTIHNSFDRQAVLMRVGDRVIAVSEAVRVDMLRKGVPAGKISVVRNGTVGGARRPFMPDKIATLRHPSISTIAGLHPRKGIADLIDAFALIAERNADANLYIVGEGPYRAEYEAQAAAATGGERIHFLGHLIDPREILGDSDVFVLASHQDPFALVLGEARLMNCAIIGTAVDGTPEALWHGKKGRLVPARSPKALAGALKDWLDNPDERKRFAIAAGSDLDDIRVGRMARETIEVYEAALARVRTQSAPECDNGREGDS